MAQRHQGEFSTRAIGVAAACVVGNFCTATPMVNALFGLYLIPLSQEFGWGRTQVSLALTIVAVCGVLAFPLIGWLSDRFGARPILLIGNLAFGLAIAGLSWVDDLASYYAVFCLVGLASAAFSTVLFCKVIAAWFDTNRGLMLGLTAGIGNGAGSTIMPLVIAGVLAVHGWRASFQWVGLIIIALGLPVLWLLLRDRPAVKAAAAAPPLEGVLLGEAVRTRAFVIMFVAIALGAGGLTALFTHIIALLSDRGLPMGLATGVLVTFALTATGWQVALGAVLDRVRTPLVAAPFFILAAIGLAMLAVSSDPAILIGGAVLLGLGLGTEYGLLPFWIPRYFGRRAFGAIYGLIYGGIVLVMGVTPALMDAVFDATDSYDFALYAIGAALLIGAVLVSALRPYVYNGAGATVRESGAPSAPAPNPA